ncbi:thioredoxin [Fusarium pseudocircinatum]|uniref:Thioredoxin n=1 Tax=Fusarium pseudocircinatum TaxID=56676 RepID=A0A8H5KVS4_9HYPO|nr:thioredoxin [Fusarium pseudocircinatum]
MGEGTSNAESSEPLDQYSPSEQEFKEALGNHSLVFVAFLATWVAPCRVIKPIIDRVSNNTENEHVYFFSVDIDNVPEVSEDQGIRSTPALVVFEDGVKQHEVVGANPQAIHAMLQKVAKKE